MTAVDNFKEQLKALRKEAAMTLAQLSADTGISVSVLSRLESGERQPSLEMAVALSQAFNTSVDEMLLARQQHGHGPNPATHNRPVQRNGMTFIPLTKTAGPLRPFKMVIPPFTNMGDAQANGHAGYEWLYVISGEMRLVLGDEVFEIAEGEVAEFDTLLPHLIGNAKKKQVEVLALFSEHGEKFHTRASARANKSRPN